MVLAAKEEYSGVSSYNSRINSVLISCRQLVRAEVGGDDGGQASVKPGVKKIVEAGNGELIGKFGAEIVKNKQVAFHILVRLGLVWTVSALESVRLNVGYYVLRAVVKHVKATVDYLPRNSG